MAAKKEDCIRDKFSKKLDPKYGYYVRDCKDKRERRLLAFLVSILCPKKSYNLILTLANTLLLAYSKKRWWIGEISLGSWCTSWHPIPNADSLHTLVIFTSTFMSTKTCLQTNRRSNGQGIRSCGSSRPRTQSQRWVTRTPRRKMRWNVATMNDPYPKRGS
jgi:hypothetical protein